MEDATIERSPVPSLLVRTVGTAPGEIKQTIHMLSSIDPSLACKPMLDQFGILNLLAQLIHLG